MGRQYSADPEGSLIDWVLMSSERNSFIELAANFMEKVDNSENWMHIYAESSALQHTEKPLVI